MSVDIRPKRTNTSGATPSSLSSGEIYVNMADKKAFIHNGTSAVQIAGGKLTALGDVSVSSPSNGHAVVWNGSAWVNAAPTTPTADNTTSLGTSSNRFSATYTNGIASGAVGAPLWKWGRIALGPKDIINGLSPGANLMWQVSLSAIGTSFSSLMYSITLIGDNGLVVGSCEKIQNYSINSGVMEANYAAFGILPTSQTALNIYQYLFFGGVYDAFYSYFHSDPTNWDGTTNSRGYLEVFYTTP